MRKRILLALSVVVVALFVGTAWAAEVTVSGNIMCAHCVLKKADAKECQDVLVVPGDSGAAAKEYYIAKNAVSEK